MSLIKVWTETDDGRCHSLPARIVSKNGNVFSIKYLSATGKRVPHKNKKIYNYEEDTYNITDESITEYINSEYELDLGFEEIAEGFVKYESDSDDDYVPSDDDDGENSSSSSSEDENETDEDEVDDDVFSEEEEDDE